MKINSKYIAGRFYQFYFRMNEPIDHIYCCQNFTCCPDANSSVYQISPTDKHTQNISVIIGNGFTNTSFIIDGWSLVMTHNAPQIWLVIPISKILYFEPSTVWTEYDGTSTERNSNELMGIFHLVFHHIRFILHFPRDSILNFLICFANWLSLH